MTVPGWLTRKHVEAVALARGLPLRADHTFDGHATV
jgi:hypothetical protein